MTALQNTAAPTLSPAQRRGIASSSVMPLRRFAGLLLVAVVIALLEATGRPAGLDPAVLIPMAVLAGAALDGLVGGSIAAVIGGLYLALYFADPSGASAVPTARVLVGLAGTALSVLVAAALRDRATSVQRRAASHLADVDSLIAFAGRLGAEQPETVARAVVRGAAELLNAHMAVLTVLDPPTGRHIVRAAHGGSASAVGVEVTPGTGVTGQVLREHRLIVAGAPTDAAHVARLQRRLKGGAGVAQTIAAVPCLQAGRVIATLTVGRSDGTPFGPDEQRLLQAAAPLVTLAVTGSLARREADEGSPRDPLTGLYNRAYLEAALSQLIALHRRLPEGQRPPLAMIIFDIDKFTVINDRHGQQVGDHVLRAVATLMRQRFRQSDVVARVGPDSFYVVLNGAGADVAAQAAAQIRRQVRELNLAGASGEPVGVSMSAGYAVHREGERAEMLFRSAEQALESARFSASGAVAAT